jgi:hypothetical protein
MIKVQGRRSRVTSALGPRQKGHVARAIAGQARPQGLSRSTGLVCDNEGEINVLNTSRYGVVNVPNFLTVEQKIA